MKLTKRGFLQSIGSVLAAGTVADKAQSVGLEKMALNAPIGGLIGAPAQHLSVSTIPEIWSWPSWKAKERAERKKRFLQNADAARWRSGQFTTHEQKKQRWIMKREYRRFMAGPYREDWRYESIQQWKDRQTIGSTLEDLKQQLCAAEANPIRRW